jgi:NHLM bacteriocin system ABC transporter ATP-binding protein
MWLQTESESAIQVISTPDLVTRDPTWKGLDHYHSLMLDRLYKLAIQTQKDEQSRLQAKAQAEQDLLSSALGQLATVLDKDQMPTPSSERATHDPLVIACQWVCQALGIPAETLARAPEKAGQASVALDRIAQAMRVQKRRVVLHGEWWHQENGPLLAFEGEQAFEHPVALLQRTFREYELCDPVRQTRTLVTRQVAETLHPFAYAFYRPFPARALSAWDLVRFGFQGNRSDLRTFLLAGVAGGTLALLVPLTTGWLLNELIPDNEFSQISQVFAALLVSAIASTAFHFARSIALVRIQARVSASLQAAIWDRLLNLPTSFFRRFSAGDLASRAMGVETIRRTLTTTTLSAIFGGVFAVLNIGMMFYYSPRLAWISALLVLVVVATATIVGYAQTGHQRHLTRIRGQLYGLILQLVTGITKLRVAGAEGRAFAFWSKRFRAQKDWDYRAQRTVNLLSTLHAVYPTLNAMVLFALAAATSGESGTLSAGDFVAFYAAFGQLLSAGLQTSASLLAIFSIVPVYERARPILETLPEVDDLKADPGELSGEIDVDHVDFSYHSSGPQILYDLSLHIEPGEFIALVGPSGSGKSTLFRLLLGFEAPQAGTILYDGQELNKLNIRAVRRQIGVVLQTGKLVRGTVLENIVGSAPLTVEEAWQAARLVGLDQDIEQMPMGMYTVISTGGSTLSGGQRQRILIARAIVHRPRILLFDEATSALDNITQATVSQSLAHIQATRIVIAHRLSTIRQADRILVLEHGRIVQVGTYAELASQQGLFTDLARRQTL